MKRRVVIFCLLLALVLIVLGCNIGIDKDSYKYKIFVISGGTNNHIIYSNDFKIDEHGFLTVVNPIVQGEPEVSRAICSPGTYFILER